MSQETRDFVRELSRDLAPVERIPRLRVALLGPLALWLVVTAVRVAAQGLSASASDPERLWGGFGALLAGLGVLGLGGLLAGLASAVPGREAAARAGGGLVGVGVLLGLGLAAVLLRGDPLAAVAPRPGSNAACLVMATLVAVLPVLAALRFVARAAPARAPAALAAAAVGAVALGAFTAQLGCGDDSFRHLMTAHALAPPIGAAVLLPVLLLVHRRLTA